jgi:hypothetical protein
VKGKLWYATERRRLIRQQQLDLSKHPPIRAKNNGFHDCCNSSNDFCTSSNAEDDDNLEVLDDKRDDDVVSFDDLLRRLRKNDISILRLGWSNSDYFSDSSNVGNGGSHHHQNNSNLSAFERALRMNVSIRSISLGWRLSKSTLVRILHALTYEGVPLHQLRHLKIAILGNEYCCNKLIPATILTDLFNRQQKLISIDLRSVQVSKSNPQQVHSIPISKSKQSGAILQQMNIGSVVTHCILPQYRSLLQLKSLALIDCDVTGDIAIQLSEFLHIRGGIADLSLRSNRKLSLTSSGGENGLRMICQAPVMRKLDLSLCDLDGLDVAAIADGIASRPWPIGEVVLAGNYRMEYMGLNALLQTVCCEKMVALDVSYCGVTSDRLVKVFNSLTLFTPGNTLLRRMVLRGSVTTSDLVVVALQELLQSECPIRSLHLHDPHEPKPMTLKQLRMIADCMENNYDLEELLIDHDVNIDTEHTGRTMDVTSIWKDLNFYLQLNKAGRRILRTPRPVMSQTMISGPTSSQPRSFPNHPLQSILYNMPDDDWFRVLEKAGKGDSLDVLNWIVRHSGENHFRNSKM